MKSFIKKQFKAVSLNFFRNSTQEYFQSRLDIFGENKEIFNSNTLVNHFGHEEISESAFQNVVGGFIIDRLLFIQDSLSSQSINDDSFIDIGDSDGLFLKSLKKNGISANISEMIVKIQSAKGYVTVQCDAEHLPFRSNSIDHILFFQIFEHLQNPIKTLKELHRVAKKSVFLSIPDMTTTNIHMKQYNPDWFIFEHHIFEFSREDFRKIVTHTGFRINRTKIINVFSPKSLPDKLLIRIFSFFYLRIKRDPEYSIKNRNDILFGCFRRFGIYQLIKNE